MIQSPNELVCEGRIEIEIIVLLEIPEECSSVASLQQRAAMLQSQALVNQETRELKL